MKINKKLIMCLICSIGIPISLLALILLKNELIMEILFWIIVVLVLSLYSYAVWMITKD